MTAFNQDNKPAYRQSKTAPKPAPEAGRLPPQNTDLEETVLGALMLEKDTYSDVSEILSPDSFYEPRNAMIYEAIQQLGFNQRPIDMLTVIEQLRSMGTLEKVGGVAAITALTSRITSAAHAEYHARLIAQKHLGRRLISFASSLLNNAYEEATDIDDLLQQAEGELFDISQTQLKREVQQIDPVINEALRMARQAAQNENGISGLPSGFTKLDEVTNGWQNSDLIIIAARPAMGKTAFVLSMAKNMVVEYQKPVAFFSLEMSSVQLVNRLISNVCEIESEKLRSGNITPSEWESLDKNVNRLYAAPLYVDETPGLSITELRTKARRLVREKGVKIIIIDYLQLMNATGMRFGSREQEVSTISRSLKALAKELNIPIIALSQLNRSTETREDKRPVLSDLRESGAIEQDADFVAFIHRPEYYTRSDVDAEGQDIRGLAEFIVAKHRSGKVGTVKMRFTSKYVRFDNWDSPMHVRRVTVQSRMNSEPDDDVPSSGAALGPGSLDGGGPGGYNPFNTPAPDIMPGPGSDPVPF